MKKLISALLCLCLMLSFTACSIPGGGTGGTAICQHRDANDDSLCDKCSESYTDGKDIPDAPVCQHRDADDNEKCDKCGEDYADGKDIPACQHRDEDDNKKCDKCGEDYTDGKDIPDAPVCQHRDADDNEKCDECGVDYADGKDIPDAPVCQHRDADDNEKCDKCGEDYTDGIDLAHTHLYGAWIQYGNAENTPCQNQLFYRTCSSCGGIEWKDGGYENHSFETVTFAPTCQAEGYDELTCTVCGLVDKVNIQPITDHDYNTTYESNNSFHWLDCKNCDAKDAYAEHTADESGFCITCNAPLAPTEGVVYDVSADGTYAEVIGYTGTATKILIAETYEGLPVKVIYDEAFENNDTIKQVVIPDSVTSIGYEAFCDCDALTSMTTPDSVTSIGSYAFAWCTSLTSVTIGNSVTSIGYQAFYDCYSLTSVTIGNSVTSISERAFYDCDALTSVYIEDIAAWCGIDFGSYDANPLYYAKNLYLNGELVTDLVIPDSVTSIGEDAFAHCSFLTSVTIGNSVTSIGSYAFYYCDSLTSVTIGNCAAVIGQKAFYGCHSSLYTEYEFGSYVGDAENPYAILIGVTNKNLSTYKMHEDTKIIAYGAFSGCDRMTSIAIPDGVRSIGEWAFAYCDALTSVTIPDSVTSIGEDAFYGCSALTSVTIGNSVTSIGGWAFQNCSALTSVYYKGDTAEWNAISFGSYGNSYLTNATRYYYSEEAPTTSGRYWHYDADGKVTVW